MIVSSLCILSHAPLLPYSSVSCTHTHTHTHTSTYVQVVCDPQRGSLEESRLTGNPRMHQRVGSSSSPCKRLLPMKFPPLLIYSLFNLFHILFQLIWFYSFPPFSLHCIIEKAREFQKDIYFCFIDSAKAFVWITTNCGKFFKRWE